MKKLSMATAESDTLILDVTIPVADRLLFSVEMEDVVASPLAFTHERSRLEIFL